MIHSHVDTENAEFTIHDCMEKVWSRSESMTSSKDEEPELVPMSNIANVSENYKNLIDLDAECE